MDRPITELNVAELQTESDILLMDMTNIREQLERAKSDAVEGVYSDATWFRSATKALRIKGIQHQAVLRELGNRRRAEKSRSTSSFERFFVEEAERLLDKETVSRIREAALARSH